MAHYHKDEGKSPKRHYALSNSPVVHELSRGRLNRFKGKGLCRSYLDKQGRRRYVGGRALKKSEWAPQLLGASTHGVVFSQTSCHVVWSHPICITTVVTHVPSFVSLAICDLGIYSAQKPVRGHPLRCVILGSAFFYKTSEDTPCDL